MSWRHLMITKKGKLSVEHSQLKISQEEGVIKIPLEDICSILIEEPAVVITSVALSKMAEFKIALFTCDGKMTPNGMLQSFCQHSRQLAVWEMQQSISKPFKNRLWKLIIQSKIENQAQCLDILGKEGSPRLYSIARSVESADRSNREAYAARIYFQLLFGKEYTRKKDNTINIALNYGYSIVRSLVARALTLYGLHPSLGLFHDSHLNAFNLADDFVEAYRPIVDLQVASRIHQDDPWTKNLRAYMVNVVNRDVLFIDERISVTRAVEETVKSFVTSIRSQDPSMVKLPSLLPLKTHQYE